ncbi:MAG TPA: hypothetical protein VIY86_11340, partial [Pirellulaceae bacterium]
IQETYRTLRAHGDLVLFHLDNGVPWPEALDNKPFHPNMQAELDVMRQQARHFRKVYVSATPQSHDRATLAKHWSVDQHQELPKAWRNKKFDDPQVIAAYINYCRSLIEFFDPDYFAYGIEVNGTLTPRHANYKAFLTFVKQVHGTLKRDYPALPIFVTFQTGSFEASWEEQWELNRILVRYSDMVGMSTYPFWVPNHIKPRRADVAYLPRDWFSRMADLAPDKPFAVTETGYIAEDFRQYGVSIQGRPEWQARYVDFLLQGCQEAKAEFVVWFVPRDYDQGMATLRRMGVSIEGAEIWRDTGLLDGSGRRRSGLDVWDAWRQLPHRAAGTH